MLCCLLTVFAGRQDSPVGDDGVHVGHVALVVRVRRRGNNGEALAVGLAAAGVQHHLEGGRGGLEIRDQEHGLAVSVGDGRAGPVDGGAGNHGVDGDRHGGAGRRARDAAGGGRDDLLEGACGWGGVGRGGGSGLGRVLGWGRGWGSKKLGLGGCERMGWEGRRGEGICFAGGVEALVVCAAHVLQYNPVLMLDDEASLVCSAAQSSCWGSSRIGAGKRPKTRTAQEELDKKGGPPASG